MWTFWWSLTWTQGNSMAFFTCTQLGTSTSPTRFSNFKRAGPIGISWLSPDSNVHGANMGPTWVLSAPDGPHVGPTNLAIRAGQPQLRPPRLVLPFIITLLSFTFIIATQEPFMAWHICTIRPFVITYYRWTIETRSSCMTVGHTWCVK